MYMYSRFTPRYVMIVVKASPDELRWSVAERIFVVINQLQYFGLSIE